MPLPVQDDSSWPRHGPVRVLQGGRWKRKNGPVACDLCRKRRVRCSGFETGAPCHSCKSRDSTCTVGDDSYRHDAPEQTTLFRAILPPPANPSFTPPGTQASGRTFDLDDLRRALEASSPRPAPLVWSSPDENLILPDSPTRRRHDLNSATRLLRPQKRKAKQHPPESDGSNSESSDEEKTPLTAVPSAKRRKAPARQLAFVAQEDVVVEAAVALFSLKQRQLIPIKAWKASGMQERGCQADAGVEGSRVPSVSFPTSATRDDPFPSGPQFASPVFAPFSTAEPRQYAQTLTVSVAAAGSTGSYHSRRASLISSTSTEGTAFSSLFEEHVQANREASVTTVESASGDLEMAGGGENVKEVA
ncbi:hypothetical protein JCM11641_006847 [Rhodosporidiobolus odoratus]